MSGGFLKAEGLEADWTVSPPGVSAVKALEEGRADVIQSAPSQAFTALAKGETPTAIHFAQIYEMDGFFITGRAPNPDFDWKRLEASEVILFGGGQPLAMFKYACHKGGIDFAKLKVIALGSAEEMDNAFREGNAILSRGGFSVTRHGPIHACAVATLPQRSDDVVPDLVGHAPTLAGGDHCSAKNRHTAHRYRNEAGRGHAAAIAAPLPASAKIPNPHRQRPSHRRSASDARC
jgi:hypothetical protein